MHRTNLYLTEVQERELDARARRAGLSRSALVRSIIDRELTKPQSIDGALQQSLGQIADDYQELIGDLFDDDPDLRIDR
jgi:hypothetical protein